MDVELKTEWVAALRSGQYRQGTASLYQSAQHTHCCMGVLSAVMGTPRSEINDRGYFFGDVLPYEAQKACWYRNDGTGPFMGRSQSFDQIADYIEANL